MTRLRSKLMDVGTFAPVGAVRGLILTPDPGVGVVAGLLALFAAFWNLHVVLLFMLVVVAGGLDLLVGARRASLQEKAGTDAYSKDKLDDGMVNKAVILVVSLFIGICVDTVVAMTGNVVDLGLATPFREFTPITASMLFYRLLREIASIMRNVDQTPGGRDAIWPALAKVIDTLRYRLAVNPAAVAAPARRWTDELTPEEQEQVTAFLAERRKTDTP